MFERSMAPGAVAAQRPVSGPDGFGPWVESAPGLLAEDVPAPWVEPSADVVALWAAMDTAWGQCVDPGEYARAAAQRLDDFA
ncbi:MAG: hypothetical protein ACOH2F_10515, partial [Cellulomonas sp.]